jgi:hypothetical protein
MTNEHEKHDRPPSAVRRHAIPRLSNDTFNAARNLGCFGCSRKPGGWRRLPYDKDGYGLLQLRAQLGSNSKTSLAFGPRADRRPPAIWPAERPLCCRSKKGNVVTLKLTCYEFRNDYKAGKCPRHDMVAVTSLDQQGIPMNSKCATFAAS